MQDRSTARRVLSTAGNRSIRTVLVVPFVVQVVVLAALVGVLGFDSGRQDINALSQDLRRELSARIEQQIETFLAAPRVVTQLNADAIATGHLPLDNPRAWQPHLYSIAEAFPTLELVYFGGANGEYVAIQRKADRPLQFEIMDAQHPGTVREYDLDENGVPAIDAAGEYNYDPRLRPWYLAAQEAGRPIWSDIYQYCPTPVLGITYTRPVYDEQNALIGVLAVDFTLKNLSTYLAGLAVGKTGETFIVDQTGMLVASSTEVPFAADTLRTSCDDESAGLKLPAAESQDPRMRATTTFLIDHYGGLQNITEQATLEFGHGGRRQLIQVQPYSDAGNTAWLIVVVVPEADFMEQINANTRTTLALMVLAAVVAILSGMVTARWITRPLLALNHAAQNMAQGQWSKVPRGRTREVRQLAQAFNAMAEQLQESIETLEKRVESRTAELAQANAQLQQDIVLRERTEAARLELAVTRERTQMITSFISQASHEFRTPLAIIKTSTHLIKRLSDPEKQARQIEHIDTQVNTMSQLLDDLIMVLTLETEPPLTHSRINLSPIIQAVVDRNDQAHSDRFNITHDIDPDLPRVLGDSAYLYDAIRRIWDNAIQHTPEGGSISITARAHEDNIIIAIHNGGDAIPDDVLPHIFKNLYRADSAATVRGFGLGLPIARTIVQKHSGHITVETSSEAGTTFTIWLPTKIKKPDD